MAPLYFPKLIQINFDLGPNVKNEMTLIDAKYDADKVTSRKTKWLRFSAYTA